MAWIDQVINRSLTFEVEDLQNKYESQIDLYRREYLENKSAKRIEKLIKLEELQSEGKNVQDIIAGA